MPDYLSGVFAKEAGVVKVKVALETSKELSIKQGADLKYSTNVIHIDHQKGVVTCEDGLKYQAKNIVVACGALTENLYEKPN